MENTGDGTEEFSGTEEDLTRRLLVTITRYDEARVAMAMIRAMRKELPTSFKQLLELKMMVRFHEYNDAVDFLQEAVRYEKDFMLRVIDMVTRTFIDLGEDATAKYSELFRFLSTDNLFGSFQKTVDHYPNLDMNAYLALIVVRADAFGLAAPILMKHIKNSSTILNRLVVFGNRMAKASFPNLIPDEIILLTLSILRSKYQEHSVNRDNDKSKLKAISMRFVAQLQTFLIAAFSKLGLSCPAKIGKPSEFAKALIGLLPNTNAPFAPIVVGFVISIALLKCPNIDKNKFLCPWSTTLLDGDGDPPTFKKNPEFIAHSSMVLLNLLFAKVQPSTQQFRDISQLFDADDLSKLVVFSQIYSSKYDDAIKYIEETMEAKSSDNPSIKACELIALAVTGKRSKAITKGVEFVEKWMDDSHLSYEGLSRKLTKAGQSNSCGSVVFLGQESRTALGLLFLERAMCQPEGDDGLFSIRLVLSQICFEVYGYRQLNELMSNAKKQGSLDLRAVLDSVTHLGVMSRLICLLLERADKIQWTDDTDESTKHVLLQKKMYECAGQAPESQIKIVADFVKKHSVDLISAAKTESVSS